MSRLLKQNLVEFMAKDLEIHNQEHDKYNRLYSILNKHEKGGNEMASYNDLKHNDKDRRSYNYKQLKDAGFNSYEANRYKDFSPAKIKTLITTRRESLLLESKIAGDKYD